LARVDIEAYGPDLAVWRAPPGRGWASAGPHRQRPDVPGSAPHNEA